ncbi:MAG: 2-oxoglutarate dehydrogenase complex dihydrolipoyllysine-residue succinyltransferase [Bacteroidales bacterium]
MIEVKIPSPGESITEVEIANWLVENGDFVEKDQEVAEIESDKATLPLVAEESGRIEIIAAEGETIKVGETACKIDTEAQPKERKSGEKESKTESETKHEPKEEKITGGEETKETKTEEKESRTEQPDENKIQKQQQKDKGKPVKTTPAAQKAMNEYNLSVDDVLQGLRRLTREDVEKVHEELNSQEPRSASKQKKDYTREEEKKKISKLRQKLSERLVGVKNETAMLTTFNEADMSAIIDIRKKYQEKFIEKHGVKLGFMSFFIKAAAHALHEFPNVNSRIENDEIVYPKYKDIGIAVQTPKGLMVPVIRNVESLTIPEIEKQVNEYAQKAQKNRISIDEMQGGTFTITNGGVFGSLLSTPIINPPQSGILGMHNIQERPVAIDGEVKIRPMMYLALSYDHRTIDGKESVSFLVKLKELIETPGRLLMDEDPEQTLLDL